MKRVKIDIREIDKGERKLTLYNFRSEIVNVLYKETITNATRSDLQFFVLLYFVILQDKDGRTLLEEILDYGLPKFRELNQAFSSDKAYLRTGDYAELKSSSGLDDLMEKDLFFIFADSLSNFKNIVKPYDEFYNEFPELKQAFERLETKYTSEFKRELDIFKEKKISDYRTSDSGETLDLSKSVYRTVKMRSSRNFDLNLQKFAEVKSIRSESPIDISLIQHLDPDIIIHLWNQYHVATYMYSFVNEVKDNYFLQKSLEGTFYLLVRKYNKWKRTDSKADPKGRRLAKGEFDTEKDSKIEALESVNQRLLNALLNSNESHREEVNNLKTQLRILEEKVEEDQDKAEIKRLTERVEILENIEVGAELID